MSFWIPVGFDRADGVTQLPAQPQGSGGGTKTVGTANPAGCRFIYGDDDGTNIQEEVDSPEIERAEQGTFQHRFVTSFVNATNLISGLGRGTFVEDSFANVWRVLSSKIQSIRGGDRAILSVVAESISFDTPPDDFQMIPVELGIDIIKHPRYFWALNIVPADNSTFTTVGDTKVFYSDIKESIIRMIQTYRDSPFFPSANLINGLIQTNIVGQIKVGLMDVHVPNPDWKGSQDTLNGNNSNQSNRWDGFTAAGHKPPGNFQYYIVSVPVNLSDPTDPVAIALAAAREILFKIWSQEDIPYQVGFQVTWSQYFFKPVLLNPGGYIQDPVGVVPDYFLSPDDGFDRQLARGDLGSSFGNLDTVPPISSGGATIFDDLPFINPQSYSDNGLIGGDLNISWLRKSDEITYERTWFRYTKTWIGSPNGLWDKRLYSGDERPQNANDFQANF